jgi:hypothetical protein
MSEQGNRTHFKPFEADDKVVTRTLLHEQVPITGTYISGAYVKATSGLGTGRGINVRSFSHGMFQSVYDYPYLSSSANHLFDITTGFSTGAAGGAGGSVSGSATNQVSKKTNIYNQMSQILAGYDVSGSIRRLDGDGDHATSAGKINNAIFINFSRLLIKDEIKKGSVSMTLGTDIVFTTPFGATATITDAASATNYRVNSPAGEYGFLKTSAQAASATLSSENDSGNGQIITFIALKANGELEAAETFTAINGANAANNFNKGGVDAGLSNLKASIEANADIKDLVTVSAVTRPGGSSGPYEMTITQIHAGAAGNTAIVNGLSGMGINGAANDADGAFTGGVTAGTTLGLVFYQAGIVAMTSSVFGATAQIMNNATSSHDDVLKKDTIDNFADGVRNRIKNITFNNTTEINSSMYFCRLNNNEFNYSTNPTYLKDSKIVVKSIPGSSNQYNEMPFSYVTTVGLYSEINELLAVAKLSEPVKKTPENEMVLRVRLDF